MADHLELEDIPMKPEMRYRIMHWSDGSNSILTVRSPRWCFKCQIRAQRHRKLYSICFHRLPTIAVSYRAILKRKVLVKHTINCGALSVTSGRPRCKHLSRNSDSVSRSGGTHYYHFWPLWEGINCDKEGVPHEWACKVQVHTKPWRLQP